MPEPGRVLTREQVEEQVRQDADGLVTDVAALARSHEQLRVDMEATEADALLLLDQHISAELEREARRRLIERAATRHKLAAISAGEET